MLTLIIKEHTALILLKIGRNRGGIRGMSYNNSYDNNIIYYDTYNNDGNCTTQEPNHNNSNNSYDNNNNTTCISHSKYS